ncbi:hypothetical protein [Natronococcus roseus]|uniref:hypothetical protein n=1 Tax=Natronococcus roseus TaxID=1052014 RepID=UPI00374D54F5
MGAANSILAGMSAIANQSIGVALTLIFAYLGWRASAIPGETDRIRNVRERFGETGNITSFYAFRLLRVQVIEREGFLMKAAKYIPPFPYQGRASVYLRFDSYEDAGFPRIASVDQITDHPDYNGEYHIARMTKNDYGKPSVDITLAIETGEPKRIHGSIRHLSAVLQDIGEQSSPPDDYYNPDYSWSVGEDKTTEVEESVQYRCQD